MAGQKIILTGILAGLLLMAAGTAAPPAGTPDAVVKKLHSEISSALDTPEVQKQFDAAGAMPLRMTPAEFGAHMAAETEKWGRVVKEGKITAQ